MLIHKGLCGLDTEYSRTKIRILSFTNLEVTVTLASCADYTGLHLPWVNISWTADASLKFMVSLGIERAILSISTPGIPFGFPEEVRDIARKVGLSKLALHCPALPLWLSILFNHCPQLY